MYFTYLSKKYNFSPNNFIPLPSSYSKTNIKTQISLLKLILILRLTTVPKKELIDQIELDFNVFNLETLLFSHVNSLQADCRKTSYHIL